MAFRVIEKMKDTIQGERTGVSLHTAPKQANTSSTIRSTPRVASKLAPILPHQHCTATIAHRDSKHNGRMSKDCTCLNLIARLYAYISDKQQTSIFTNLLFSC